MTGGIEMSPLQVTRRDTRRGPNRIPAAPSWQPSLGNWDNPAAGLINGG